MAELTPGVTPKNTIYSWFETGDFPTEAQFRATWDSFWHKDESIPTSKINGLTEMFGNTVSTSQFQSHLTDANAHADYLAKRNASNLSPEDVAAWKTKLKTSFSLAKSEEVQNKLTYEVEDVKRIYSIGSQSVYNTTGKTMYESVISGFNILTDFIGKQEDLDRYTSGYINYGIDIYPDFVGNTSYRPSHPAHDSWVGFGRKLGYGVLDGTNSTLIGTTVFHLNDNTLWDSVTAVGKGITNAAPPYNSPSRIATSSNGFNMRQMMTDVVAVGNEIWCGDIQKSTILGSSIKNYKYIFNSIAIGNQIQADTYPVPDMVLDNDIIIANAFYKDPDKYAPSHNFIVGSTEGYGIGTFKTTKRPLLVGNFLDPFLEVNGRLETRIDKEKYSVGTDILPPEVISKPTGVVTSYDSSTYILNINVGEAATTQGDYLLAEDLVDGNYLLTIDPQDTWIDNGGTWGLEAGDALDSGNNAAWTYIKKPFNVNSETLRTVKFTISGNPSGDVKIIIYKIDPESPHPSELSFKDLDNNPLFELRTGTSSEKGFVMGVNSALVAGGFDKSVVLGSESVKEAIRLDRSSIVGNDILKTCPVVSKNYIIGNNIANNCKFSARNIFLGANSLGSAVTIARDIVIGDTSLTDYVGSPVGTDPDSTEQDGDFIVVGNGSLIGTKYANKTTNLGSGSVGSETCTNAVIVGYRAETKLEGTGTISDNEIVIGAKAKGHGSNTATIGSDTTTELWVGGNGAGIVLKSPDGTKSVKISIDNSGNLITTPVGSKSRE